MNGDSGSTLVRTGVSSSGCVEPVIVKIELEENETGGSIMMNIDVSSDSD